MKLSTLHSLNSSIERQARILTEVIIAEPITCSVDFPPTEQHAILKSLNMAINQLASVRTRIEDHMDKEREASESYS